MPTPSIKLSEALAKRYQTLEITRTKIENLAFVGEISQRDADRAYEGLFLSINATFETFLEDLFIGLLVDGTGLQSSRASVRARVLIRSYQVARELILGPKRHKYINWMPYNRTVDLAKIYFHSGRPFSELDDSKLQTLKNCHTIRNAIAHKSRYSVQKFRSNVIGTRNLPMNEKNPARYLRGIFRINPTQTRYENLVTKLILIARKLSW